MQRSKAWRLGNGLAFSLRGGGGHRRDAVEAVRPCHTVFLSRPLTLLTKLIQLEQSSVSTDHTTSSTRSLLFLWKSGKTVDSCFCCTPYRHAKDLLARLLDKSRHWRPLERAVSRLVPLPVRLPLRTVADATLMPPVLCDTTQPGCQSRPSRIGGLALCGHPQEERPAYRP